MTPSLKRIISHYEKALLGGRDRGSQVGWKNAESQLIRFQVMKKLTSDFALESICDIGCGQADYLTFLRESNWSGKYYGIDISTEMIKGAVERNGNDSVARFKVGDSAVAADGVISSGIFNVKLDVSQESWTPYCFETIKDMWNSAGQLVAFNMLSLDSDPDKRDVTLSYFNPSEVLSFVRNELSTFVKLDQSYGQFDFTVVVSRHSSPKTLGV